MKSYKLLFTAIIIVAVLAISSCTGAIGPQGEQGPPGSTATIFIQPDSVDFDETWEVYGVGFPASATVTLIFKYLDTDTWTDWYTDTATSDVDGYFISEQSEEELEDAALVICEAFIGDVLYGAAYLNHSGGTIADEARRTEKTTIQHAVMTMMIDNKLGATLPNPVDTTPTNDMSAFPDNSTIITQKVADPDSTLYQAGDQGGYYLRDHDIIADNAATGLVNYVDSTTRIYYYTCDSDGTVHQWADAAKTGGEFTD